jgi:hypothetical protein
VRWPPWRREPAGRTGTGVDVQPADGGGAPVDSGPPGWLEVPAMKRTVGPIPDTFKVGAAVRTDLVAPRPTRLTRPLGHHLSATGPTGYLLDLAIAAPVAQRSAEHELPLTIAPRPAGRDVEGTQPAVDRGGGAVGHTAPDTEGRAPAVQLQSAAPPPPTPPLRLAPTPEEAAPRRVRPVEPTSPDDPTGPRSTLDHTPTEPAAEVTPPDPAAAGDETGGEPALAPHVPPLIVPGPTGTPTPGVTDLGPPIQRLALRRALVEAGAVRPHQQRSDPAAQTVGQGGAVPVQRHAPADRPPADPPSGGASPGPTGERPARGGRVGSPPRQRADEDPPSATDGATAGSAGPGSAGVDGGIGRAVPFLPGRSGVPTVGPVGDHRPDDPLPSGPPTVARHVEPAPGPPPEPMHADPIDAPSERPLPLAAPAREQPTTTAGLPAEAAEAAEAVEAATMPTLGQRPFLVPGHTSAPVDRQPADRPPSPRANGAVRGAVVQRALAPLPHASPVPGPFASRSPEPPATTTPRLRSIPTPVASPLLPLPPPWGSPSPASPPPSAGRPTGGLPAPASAVADGGRHPAPLSLARQATTAPPEGPPARVVQALAEAGAAAVANGVARRADDGSLQFAPPAGEAAPPAAPAAAPATTAETGAGAAGGAAVPTDLDELARTLYDRIRWRLRTELRLDMERAGRGSGLLR